MYQLKVLNKQALAPLSSSKSLSMVRDSRSRIGELGSNPKVQMAPSPSRPITLEEFLKLTETKPASEYIDGQIIQKPMPQGKHSTIQTEFSTTGHVVLKLQQIARAFSELRCTFGGRSIVPDISVFTWKRIPRDQNGEVANTFPIAPDWSIEILSPDQSQTKVTKNILHCLNHGTQMGWLIDPDEQTVFVYLPKHQPSLFLFTRLNPCNGLGYFPCN